MMIGHYTITNRAVNFQTFLDGPLLFPVGGLGTATFNSIACCSPFPLEVLPSQYTAIV